jgi:hypothetical protein
LAVNLLRKNTIYVGMQRSGVFSLQSLDNWPAWTWTPCTEGMHQATTVMELRVHPTTGMMRAATFGRSAYEVETDNPLGSILTTEGRLTFLRVHDVGTGFGSSLDFLDAEVIVKLDGAPLRVFGLQLRTGPNEAVNQRALDLLRDISNARLSQLRIHEVGSKFDPNTDQIDVEVMITLEGRNGAFGFQLRDDANRPVRQVMLYLLRDAFNNDWLVRIDYDICSSNDIVTHRKDVILRVWLSKP